MTDEELVTAFRKPVDDYHFCSELGYFCYEESCEYEPLLSELRAVYNAGLLARQKEGEGQ
jgi:hypothetical protein